MVEEDLLLLEKIPQARSCCLCLNINCGRKLIAILGILWVFICTAILLTKDRKYLSPIIIVLIVFLAVFIVVTILFVFTSVMLLLAALDENVGLMSYYIWLSIIYLCLQLLLTVSIPFILSIDERYPVTISLLWMVSVMIVGLGWTHFISMISKYRTNLLT